MLFLAQDLMPAGWAPFKANFWLLNACLHQALAFLRCGFPGHGHGLSSMLLLLACMGLVLSGACCTCQSLVGLCDVLCKVLGRFRIGVPVWVVFEGHLPVGAGYILLGGLTGHL